MVKRILVFCLIADLLLVSACTKKTKTMQVVFSDPLSDSLYVAVRQIVASEKARLDLMPQRLSGAWRQAVTGESHRLQMLEQRVAASDPKRMLARGYTLTLHDGRAMTDLSSLKKGDMLTTLFAGGEVVSEVNKISKNKK